MYTLDQEIRHSIRKIDSLFKVDRGSNGRFLIISQKKKKLGDEYLKYKKVQDSIYSIMKKINVQNTEKLLEITKDYGFPSKQRLESKTASAYLIFVHSPEQYHKEINSLITSEYKAKRISEYEKAYIFWHINKRKGLPPRLSKNGKIIYDQ